MKGRKERGIRSIERGLFKVREIKAHFYDDGNYPVKGGELENYLRIVGDLERLVGAERTGCNALRLQSLE